MATMSDLSILRKDPGGDELDVLVNPGAQVKVLQKSEIGKNGQKESWTWIKLLQSTGQPDGWVPSDAVNDTGVPDTSIDRTTFAALCVRQALSFGLAAHYVLGVAQLRSKIAGDQDGNAIGPFRLLKEEWKVYGGDAEFGFNFDAENIDDWTAQCAVFPLMVFKTQRELTVIIGHSPSALELYLAQMIGSKAAKAVLDAPGETVAKALQGVANNELPPGGLTGDQILDRYASLLKAGNASATGTVAITNTRTALTEALNKTGNLLQGAAATIKPSDNVASPPPGGGSDVEAPAGGVFGPLMNSDWQTYCKVLGKMESGNDYTNVNQFGYAGRWQFGAAALIDHGYVKSGTKGPGAPTADSAWTGKDGITSRNKWRSSNSVQDAVMLAYTKAHYNLLLTKGLKPTASKAHVAGLLAAAHLKGVGNAISLTRGVVTHDANGTTTLSYYRLLSKALGGTGNLEA